MKRSQRRANRRARNPDSASRFKDRTTTEGRDCFRGRGRSTVETTTLKPEDRELRELWARPVRARIISCVLRHKSTSGSGAEKELQDHLELSSSNEIPSVELLRTPVEHRAVTVAPSDVGAQQSEIVQPVFASGDANFLGARETMLQAGDAVFPVLIDSSDNRARSHIRTLRVVRQHDGHLHGRRARA